MKELWERNSATKKEYDDAQTALEAARARLEASEAMARQAEVTEEYGDVKAPFKGVVTRKLAERGDMASPGQPLVVVEDLSKVKIAFQVPESEIGRIQPGMELRFDVAAAGSASVAGPVKEIVPSTDSASRTYLVKLVVENPNGELKPGMFARVEIPIGSREGFLVPKNALSRKGELEYVFLVDSDQKARLNWVKSGRTVGSSPA
jgi:RND family efflux transporter MFP subunit